MVEILRFGDCVNLLGDGVDLLGDGCNLLGDGVDLLGDGGDLLGDGGELLGDGVDLLDDGGDLLEYDINLLDDGVDLLEYGINLLGDGGDLLGDELTNGLTFKSMTCQPTNGLRRERQKKRLKRERKKEGFILVMPMDSMKQFVGEMIFTVSSFYFLFFCTFQPTLPRSLPFIVVFR